MVKLFEWIDDVIFFSFQDINNYPPVIQAVPSNLQFLENIPVGTELLSSITVTDADAAVSSERKQ